MTWRTVAREFGFDESSLSYREALPRMAEEIVRLREENHALRAGFSASDEFGKIKCLELRRSESKRAKLREALQKIVHGDEDTWKRYPNSTGVYSIYAEEAQAALADDAKDGE